MSMLVCTVTDCAFSTLLLVECGLLDLALDTLSEYDASLSLEVTSGPNTIMFKEQSFSVVLSM